MTHKPKKGKNVIDATFGAEPGFYDLTRSGVNK